MWPFLGSLIGAGTSLLGGLMGQDNASDQFWQNVKMQNRAMKKSMLWNKKNFDFINKWTNINAKRSTLQWKMADAKRAGVHPLYALGGNSQVSFGSPSFSVGGGTPGYSGDGGMASAMGQAGQHLSRAIGAMSSQDEKNTATMMSALSIENQGLQNELLRSQIRRMNAGTGPSMPSPGGKYLIDGQGNTVPVTSLDAVTFSQRYPESKQNVQLGNIWQANPYVSNAEDVEARHGELADMLWGAVTIPSDIYWNNRDSFKRGYDWLRGQTLEGR